MAKEKQPPGKQAIDAEGKQLASTLGFTNKNPDTPKTPIGIILKVVLITLGVLITAAGLAYAGYLFGKQQAGKPKPSANITVEVSPSPHDVPFGDEDFDTDLDYKRAMENLDESATDQDTPLIPYSNQTHGFSFNYPAEVFLQETNGQNLPLIYLDTQLIIIPEAYGGMLTPVEIRVAPLTGTDYNQTVSDSKKLFVASTLKQAQLSNITGVRLTGTDYIYQTAGYPFEMVILDGPKGIIEISYTPSDLFPQDLFDQIIDTLEISRDMF